MTDRFIEHIDLKINQNKLLKQLRLDKDSDNGQELISLINEAESIACPKIIHQKFLIQNRTDQSITINNITFRSRVVSVNLEQSESVIAYVVTCGMELQDWSDQLDDYVHIYWADAIKEHALFAAIRQLNQSIFETYHPQKTSTLAPGSVIDWPITEQKKLFNMMNIPDPDFEVRLTESSLMIPNKSISGFQYETDDGFISCQLCAKEKCQNRRAAYDESLYQSRYAT